MVHSLFIDFNSYFASVEQQLNPGLRGKPIAVVPVMADTTAIIAASYEAKAYGIRTGTRVFEAKRRCPDLMFVQARHAEYVRFHHKLVETVNTVIPVKRVLSIDEMVCDLLGRQRIPDNARSIATTIKQTVYRVVGSEMRCSIGIAPNDYLAKTASDMQKPDGLVTILPDDLPDILFGLELRDLVGIGRKMHDRLYRAGIYTVQQLCMSSKETLRKVWGGIEGELMFARLRGEPVPYTETKKSSISHEHVLEPLLRNRDGVVGVLHRLLQKAAMRLRSYGLITSQVTVTIKCRNGEKWKQSTNITATQDSVQLTQVLTNALRDWEMPKSSVPIKARIELTNLLPAASATVPLFSSIGPARELLNESLDKLNTKYGKNTVYIGPAWNALSSAPMRIAFNHIPDIETDEDRTE